MNAKLRVSELGRGRLIFVQLDGTIYLSRGSRVWRADAEARNWKVRCEILQSFSRRCLGSSRLASRLLRLGVRALVVLSDGTCVTADRRGVCCAGSGDVGMVPASLDVSLSQVMPPMSLTAGPQDEVLWGEYGGNSDRREVHIFVSGDRGRRFEIGHTFAAGEVRHIHNIVFDRHIGRYWVLTGDFEHEAGMGLLSPDLKTFDWVIRGQQQHRAVCVMDHGDHLVYGTDTEKEPNAVMRLEKATGRVERLAELPGSCLHACRFGGLHVLTTTVEPSSVNPSRDATMWVSRDGERWTQVYRAAKDRWPAKLFQYGSLVLPRGESNREIILFSGQAVIGLDGKAMVARLDEGSSQE